MPRIQSFSNLNPGGRENGVEEGIENKEATSRKLSGKRVKSLWWGQGEGC